MGARARAVRLDPVGHGRTWKRSYFGRVLGSSVLVRRSGTKHGSYGTAGARPAGVVRPVAAAFSWNQGSVRAAPRENEDDDDQGTPAFIFTSDRAAMVAIVVMVAVKVVIARIFLPV